MTLRLRLALFLPVPILLVTLFLALAWAPQVGFGAAPMQSEPVVPLPATSDVVPEAADAPESSAAAAGVTLTLRAQARGQAPTAALATSNNEAVTYTIQLVNGTAGALTGARYETVLPPSGLSAVSCIDTCRAVTTTVNVINPLGVIESVVVTRELRFDLGTVGTNGTVTRRFTARAVAQVGGPAIENTALAFYTSGGASRSSVSNKVSVTLLPDVPNIELTGGANPVVFVANNPSWFSNDLGGTLDMDWADIDSDGDLDLALASTGGTSVYINSDGLLLPLWLDPQSRVSYGVRWLDVDADGTPELIVVGQSDGGLGGLNYVFRFNPGTFQSPDRFTLAPNGEFPTVAQLTRIETGQFDGDTLPDILVSVNAISAACPVFLLINQGADLFTGTPRCVSEAGSAAMSAADADRDGDVDVALGIFPNQIRVFINNSGVLTQTNFISNVAQVDVTGYFLPYDFTWGDIDSDGDLDLVAAFPLQREVRIYRNDVIPSGTMSFVRLDETLNTAVFLTPYATELADIDRDGLLDLIVADVQPTIYWNTGDPTRPYAPERSAPIVIGTDRREVWAIRAIDQDGDGALELAFANRSGPSLVLANYTPPLDSGLTLVPGAGPASSVAWGDADNDGFNDLLFGSPEDRNASRLFFNRNGRFQLGDVQIFDAEAIGAHVSAMGDLDTNLLSQPGGGRLDVVVTTPVGVRLVRNGEAPVNFDIPGLSAQGRAAALGDADGDGDLDLVVAPTDGDVSIIENRFNESPSSPRTLTIAGGLQGTTAFAWGDLNGDHYLDIAMASTTGGASRVLINNGNLTFRPLLLTPTLPVSQSDCRRGQVREVAWGDLDGDGDEDLALAVVGQRSCVLINNGGVLTFGQDLGPMTDATTLDWGDWDNDGDMDLAVGRANQKVRVFANIDGVLSLLWESSQNFPALGVRFGDVDNDGDLDLALARGGSGSDSGYFINRLVNPSHIGDGSLPGPLADAGAYASVSRPGVTRGAYLYSTSEILAGPQRPTVPINFRLYDPDGNPGDPPQQVRVLVEYAALGSRWLPATPAAGQSAVYTATLTRTGSNFTYNWNTAVDAPIGEHARVRVSVLNPSNGVQLQSAAGVGISPPFQVRATTCTWPADPIVFIDDAIPQPNVVYTIPADSFGRTFIFRATLREGSGAMRFVWDFGDGTAPAQAQRLTKALGPGTYNIVLRTVGAACPVAREARLDVRIQVGTLTKIAAMPLAFGRPAPAGSAAVVAAVEYAPGLQPPGVIEALEGEAAANRLLLRWLPPTTGGEATETMIFVEPLGGDGERILEARLPYGTGEYLTLHGCGVLYSVAAANSAGEGSSAAYLAPACTEGDRP